MSYRVEIPGGPFPRARQDELARILVTHAGIEPEEAALNVLLAPCVVTLVDAGARNRLLGALDAADFEADVLPGAPAQTPPAYAPPQAYAPAAARYTNAPPYESESPRYVEPAYVEPVYAEPTAEPPRKSNSLLLAIAAALAVLVTGLGVTALLADRDERPDEPVVVDAPPRYEGGSEPVPTTIIEDDLVLGDATDEPSEPAPATSAVSEYRLGYSPSRGVNWDVFVAADRVRYSAVTGRKAIPIRDVPSARHGDAINEVPYGSQVRTTGCLPRRDDGGRWCQVNDDQGWIYDLFLQNDPVAQRPAPPRGSAPTAPAVPSQVVVVMGSYRPSDDAGLQARYAQAQLAGIPLETGPSENYGMSPGYIVIVSGPYSRAGADRVLAQVQPHVLDAFTRTVQ